MTTTVETTKDTCKDCGSEYETQTYTLSNPAGENFSQQYGYCSCKVCDGCDMMMSDCECEEFGKTDIAPWVKRGFKFKVPSNRHDWQLVWPEIDQTMDPIQAAASFYLLEAMHSGVLYPIQGLQPVALAPVNEENDNRFFEMYGITTKKQKQAFVKQRNAQLEEKIKTDPLFKLQSIMAEAGRTMEELVEDLDHTLVAYSHMAIAGELRHHSAFSNVMGHSDRPTAWCGWRTVYANVGNDALIDAATMFYEFNGGGYGGPPWAACAETLYARLEGKLGPDGPEGKINKRMFVDRFWTLEHNGGCFLNKINWSNLNKKGWEVGHMRQLLDAHGADPMNVGKLITAANDATVNLFNRYVAATNELRAQRKLEALENIFEKMTKPLYICSGCSSDVTLGHYATCNIMAEKTYHKFNAADIAEGSGTWFYNYTIDQIEGSSAETQYLESVYLASKGKLPYDAQGNLKLKGDEVYSFGFQGKVAVDDKLGTHSFQHSKVVQLKDLLDGQIDFVPQDIVQGFDGTPDSYSYVLTLQSDHSETPLVKTSNMGYKDSKPSGWFTSKFDVAEVVKTKLGEFELQ